MRTFLSASRVVAFKLTFVLSVVSASASADVILTATDHRAVTVDLADSTATGVVPFFDQFFLEVVGEEAPSGFSGPPLAPFYLDYTINLTTLGGTIVHSTKDDDFVVTTVAAPGAFTLAPSSSVSPLIPDEMPFALFVDDPSLVTVTFQDPAGLITDLTSSSLALDEGVLAFIGDPMLDPTLLASGEWWIYINKDIGYVSSRHMIYLSAAEPPTYIVFGVGFIAIGLLARRSSIPAKIRRSRGFRRSQ